MAARWKSRGALVMAALMLIAGISAVTAPTQPCAAQDARITAAIDWALDQRNVAASKAYDGWCLAFVNDAYVKGAGVRLLAQRLGTAQQAADYFNAAANRGVPPRGAWVYYQNGSTGHVALSLGNGRCISSLGTACGGIRIHQHLLNMPYIGWAYPTTSPALVDAIIPATRADHRDREAPATPALAVPRTGGTSAKEPGTPRRARAGTIRVQSTAKWSDICHCEHQPRNQPAPSGAVDSGGRHGG